MPGAPSRDRATTKGGLKLDGTQVLWVETVTARAILNWYEAHPRAKALSGVMEAMTLLDAASGGCLPARKPLEFLTLLEKPLSSWFAAGTDEALVADGAPSAACHDLAAEGGHDPEAEVVQARVNDARHAFAMRKKGEDEYRRFRRFLVSNGHAAEFDIVRALMGSALSFDDLYEEIPGQCILETSRKPTFLPCPRCTWPMLRRAELLQCEAIACQLQGARYLIEKGELSRLGSMGLPIAVEAAGRFRLRRGPWRYTLYPGLAELELYSQLEGLKGVRCELWPGHDRYDLNVHAGGRTIHVDVKDWCSPRALAERLSGREPDQEIWIVIPDARTRQVPVLEELCRGMRWRFSTIAKFVSFVKQVVNP